MCPSGIIFSQLVHLNLSTVVKGWWDLLTSMLQDSPKLQSLKLIDVCDLYNMLLSGLVSQYNLTYNSV